MIHRYEILAWILIARYSFYFWIMDNKTTYDVKNEFAFRRLSEFQLLLQDTAKPST